MELQPLDIIVFIAFIACVIGLGLYKSRKEAVDEEGYFLAGRGLSWWLIGFSLIAANISTEQFVGMSGQAAGSLGLAIASYEWMAAITLVVVAFFFLPKFLKSGIYTIPEFLEYRYNAASRSIMAFFTMVIYVGVTIAAVIFSGALTVDTLFHGREIFGIIEINVTTASWIIGILAAVYVATGGLKACAWADLLQGSALIIGGAIVVWLAIDKLGAAPINEIASGLKDGTIPAGLENAGGIERFKAINADKLHMFLPRDNPAIPWTALMVGLWIPNFYYWGLNQYITQRTLGAKSLGEGQKGIVFAAALKLIIPFIIVVPGLIAFNLYSGDMAEKAIEDNTEAITLAKESNEAILKAGVATAKDDLVIFDLNDDFKKMNIEQAIELKAYNATIITAAEKAGVTPEEETLIGYKYDSAFALLIGKLIPSGYALQGFMLAAILGAVMSSLASMLNSASTIFTMDLYKKYVNPKASHKNLVFTGRSCVVVFVCIGCFISPYLGDPRFKGIFNYIQEFQGFISPGILAVFVFGLLVKKAPPITGVVGLLLNPPMYYLLMKALPDLSFLDRMAVSFFCVLTVMGIITAIMPMKKPVTMPVNEKMDLQSSNSAKILGTIVILATIVLYIIFR